MPLDQVSESVGLDGAEVVGVAPAVAIGNLYQTLGDSVGKAAINNVYAQQQANMNYQTASAVGVAEILNIPV